MRALFQLIKMIGFFDNKQSKKGNDMVNLSMNGIIFVRMKHGANELTFLLETGASVSIIFAGYVNHILAINTEKNKN